MPRVPEHERTYDAHCRKPECPCNHLVCDQGWHQQEVDNHTHVRPCPQCRPSTHERWTLTAAARTRGASIEEIGRIMRPEKNRY